MLSKSTLSGGGGPFSKPQNGGDVQFPLLSLLPFFRLRYKSQSFSDILVLLKDSATFHLKDLISQSKLQEQRANQLASSLNVGRLPGLGPNTNSIWVVWRLQTVPRIVHWPRRHCRLQWPHGPVRPMPVVLAPPLPRLEQAVPAETTWEWSVRGLQSASPKVKF